MKLCLVCNFQFQDEQELCPKDYSKLVPLGKDPLLGKVIQDRYRIDNIIAKGSMGVVYKATQELIGREIAVKVLHGYLADDQESVKRFQKEAKAASRLNHPNITTLYDYGLLGQGQPYIVMDLLRGSTLTDVLRQRDYLPVDEALVIFKQVGDALAEAHKRGVVHRDIKPENIMLDYTDRGVTVKVVDFGIAKFLQEQEDTIGKITKTGTVCGSPTYMSPEQCDDNPVDHRSDLYSLGVVLYETVTGRVPFSHKDIYTVMTMHVREDPPTLRSTRPDIDFPAYLQGVIDIALAKQPENRYQSAQDFMDALQGKQVNSGSRVGLAPVASTTAASQMTASTVTGDMVNTAVSRALQKKVSGETLHDPSTAATITEPVPAVDPEMVRQKVQAATQELVARRAQFVDPRNRIAPSGVSFGARIFGFIQSAFPPVLTIVLAVSLLFVLSNGAAIQGLVDHYKSVTGTLASAAGNFGKQAGNLSKQAKAATLGSLPDVDDLIAQRKYEQARAILEKRKKEGKLDEDGLIDLNSVYERLAKKEAKAKHWKAAISVLEQVSGDEREDDSYRTMLARYKRQTAGK